MIPQPALASYWSDPIRHGFVRHGFTVRINECHPRSGKFERLHMVYVKAWTHDDAKPAALKWLREVMTGRTLGRLEVKSVEYSQPVSFDSRGSTLEVGNE